MTGLGPRPVETFETVDAFRDWIARADVDHPGVWIRMAKKGSDLRTIGYDQALDVALAFGWIDSQVRRYDEQSFIQAFTPRRRRSPWSTRNRDKAESLIASGAMHPRGLAEVERAKADGRWERAYAGPAAAAVPDDFLTALECNPAAKDFFATLTSQNRYAIYYRLQDAKRPETRTRRIEKFVTMLARGEKFH